LSSPSLKGSLIPHAAQNTSGILLSLSMLIVFPVCLSKYPYLY